MAKKFRIKTIALLGANNAMKNHGEIVTKEELTGSVDDLIEEGFIEEVTEDQKQDILHEVSTEDVENNPEADLEVGENITIPEDGLVDNDDVVEENEVVEELPENHVETPLDKLKKNGKK